LHREITRHGRAVWYVRVGKGPRARIKAPFGSPEFDVEYQAAIAGTPKPKKGKAEVGTLAWLIERYRETAAWTGLSIATRRQRENIFRQVIETAGRKPLSVITEKTIAAGVDRRGSTPFQARHFVDTMRGLFAWAKKAGEVKTDPALAVPYPVLKSGQGFPVWTEDDVAAYERRWPIGTRERVWFDVLSYTGLRRGDAVRLGRQHVRNEEAVITTEKSGGKIEVVIPIHRFPALLETLRVGPTSDLAFICGANGKPMKKESFGNTFKDACRAAGVNKSAHGLRKLAATRAAENGATVHELNAMFGWTGTKMAMRYTENANRKRAAREGFKKLANNLATSIPAPDDKVRALAEK
jgi:integrase